MSTKTYILDTNVLLYDPKALFQFQDSNVILPLVVLEEIDKKKVGLGELARNAREVIRTLDGLRSEGNISHGIKTKDGGSIKIELNCSCTLPADLDPEKNDNKIISVALNHKHEGAILVSKDINVRVKCDALDIHTEDYHTNGKCEKSDEVYSGFKNIDVLSSYINELNSDGKIKSPDGVELFENQYVLLKSIDSTKHSSLARFEKGNLVTLSLPGNVWGVNSKNKEQACALDALFNDEIKLVTMIGSSGSGKTLLAVVAGLVQTFDLHKFKKIVISKSPHALSKDLQLGFLPGSLEDKMAPWLGGIFDNMSFLFGDRGKNMIEQYCEKDLIEICSLEHIRGRSIKSSFIIIDEVQNLSDHELKAIITRAGDDTKIVCIGDIEQIDAKNLTLFSNGLTTLVESFKSYDIAAHITFTKCERGRLAGIAAEIL